MKKKLIAAIMAMTMATSCAFGLTACGDSSESSEKGDDGYTFESVYAQAKALGYNGTLEEFIESISGKDGKDGVGIKNAYLNDDGELVLELTDGTEINCGKIEINTQQLQYRAVKEDGEVIGYSVVGIGSVADLDVVIPLTFNNKPVVAIRDKAFYGENELTNITIPDSVTYIGSQAFEGCGSLQKIVIPDSVTEVGKGVFVDCVNLTSVKLSNNMTEIPDYEYNSISGFFDGCSSLTSIEIPDSVTYIDSNAFYGCSSLKSITVGEGNQNYSSQDGILYNKDKTELIKAPQGISGNITIPNSVITIDGGAFDDCSRLQSVIIPEGVTAIKSNTFYGCSSLQSVIIPNSVTSIGGYAFQKCSSLRSITIPGSVTSIGYFAFQSCSSLTDIYFGGTSEQWKSIGGQSSIVGTACTVHCSDD